MAYKPRWKKRWWEADERTMAQHNNLFGEIMRGRYIDAVYTMEGFSQRTYDDGYQVTFLKDGATYTPREYATIVNEFLEYATDHRANISKFNGYPEISFHIEGKRNAFRLARKYGQESVYDWSDDENLKVPERR